MRLQLLALLAALAPSVFAIPQIVSPAAGAAVAAGSLVVKWTDDGTSPSLSQFSTYTLTLFVGGNAPDAGEATTVALGTVGTASAFPIKGETASGAISTTIAGEYTNGFYVQMIATAKDGGTVTTYSPRFTLSGMTGATNAAIQKAITSAGTTVPATVNSVSNAAPAAAEPAATAPAAGANAYQVPYNQQSGLTRYAPMQGIPPTKITLKNFTPLFPTSAYTVATTWLPIASIVTTMTEPQTFTVNPSVNYAQTQSRPTPDSDMQKFLKRWKD